MTKRTFKVTEVWTSGPAETNEYELRAGSLDEATRKARSISDADLITVEAC